MRKGAIRKRLQVTGCVTEASEPVGHVSRAHQLGDARCKHLAGIIGSRAANVGSKRTSGNQMALGTAGVLMITAIPCGTSGAPSGYPGA